jgi:hypothetical protein
MVRPRRRCTMKQCNLTQPPPVITFPCVIHGTGGDERSSATTDGSRQVRGNGPRAVEQGEVRMANGSISKEP